MLCHIAADRDVIGLNRKPADGNEDELHIGLGVTQRKAKGVYSIRKKNRGIRIVVFVALIALVLGGVVHVNAGYSTVYTQLYPANLALASEALAGLGMDASLGEGAGMLRLPRRQAEVLRAMELDGVYVLPYLSGERAPESWYHQQLQDTLAVGLRTLEAVEDAAVIVRLETTQPSLTLSGDIFPAAVSAVVRLRAGQVFSDEDTGWALGLFKAAVPDLEESNIQIIDANMQYIFPSQGERAVPADAGQFARG